MSRSQLIPFVFSALMGATVVAGAVSAQAQTYTDLHDFNGGAGDPTNFNSGRLAQARDGDFYAESRAGGSSGQGTVFHVSPSGAVSIVFSFDGTTGALATGGLTLGPSDGELYGDAQQGGTSGDGITFKITTSGTYTALHNFTNKGDGSGPVNALVVGSNGSFYGLTGSNPDTFYSVTSAGKLATLRTFTTAQGYQGGQLSLGSDGNFYGGLNLGGANGSGTLFKVTPTGTITVLHNFAANSSDGTDAAWGMVQAPNGIFFGTPYAGGANGAGTLFKITTSGTFTLLRSFAAATDGSGPGGLTLATDGNMYGVTNSGGTNNCGTLFKVTQAGVFSVVHTFASATGCNPEGSLTQGTDGILYGLTNNGGAHGNGTFFSLDLGIAPFVILQSTSSTVGSTVGILGQDFDSASVVKFNGVAATKIVLTGTTYITATVPAGASNGYVTVTTGTTTVTSKQAFTVHNSWASGAAMSTAAVVSCAAVLGGQVYVVGGFNGSPLTNNQIYNPTTNKWSAGTPLEIGLSNQACAGVNGEVYEFGGTNNDGSSETNAVWAYNPSTKVWTSKTAMPTARDDSVAVVDKGLVYVIGGYNGNRVTTVEAYNPATDTWKSEASLLVAQSGDAGGLIAANIVIADGAGESTDTGDTESYNVAKNSWTSLMEDSTVRNNPCGGAIGTSLYVAGGADRTGPGLKVVRGFAPSSNTWTSLLSIPQATVGPASAVFNGQLYCFGGWTAFEGTVLNNVQIYQP
jgi:uncharacterized repeat protein (TIGR03803 family)